MQTPTLVGQTAIVVGATGVFGQVIAASLLSKGMDVLAVARDQSALRSLAEEMPGLRTCPADIASDDSVAVIRQSLSGPVKALIHGPGVGVAGGILNADIGVLLEAVNIKVGGILRLVRAAEAHLFDGSRIIAIGGHYGLEPTAYAASAGVANAALVNVVRQLSLGYGMRGITAHTIAPGPADTERLRSVATARAQRDSLEVEDVLEQMRLESSTGSFTTPDQVAWAVSTLLADEARAMTGSTMMLDSGRRRGLP
ncbi:MULTISPECIES: SDR family NAD(P)-dependent oxidoreductase [Marinobacter]|uniref:SDR family NAD(P)-dependent oxidoreductase n=1 Tax=Marinobacter TaxID=2742 RepID=UPI000C59D4AA|nr:MULTISPECIES: SDR family oxidoreductase [Marinobacter]MAO12127.1 short-chain dehydrogenase [Marinobacter sp.]